ncbi:MAG: DNA polymerase III subunit beta [Candidatus Nomurabacteria bacterium]|nr:MAG: DNA polymerase III subunit beta [Candidatus Nomurabacteria bacterium]
MKFSCTQENLIRGLTIVSRAVGKNAALPILGNILLTAESTGIRLSATNLEIGVTCMVRAKVETPGAYTIQGRLLHDFVNLLSNVRIDIELREEGLHITTGETTTTMKGIAADEFPVIPSVEEKSITKAATNDLRQALTQVLFAAANDNSRPEINGIYVKIENNNMVLAATDSYRLAERKININASGDTRAVIVPSRALQEVVRILDTEENEMSIILGENQILFRIGDIELVSRLIEGQYPEYQEIIPKEHLTTATFSVEALSRQVRAASLFCKTGINDITLAFVAGKGVTIEAANTQVGEHSTHLEGQVDGEGTSILFNYRYLLDGLASMSSEEVQIELTDSDGPGVFRPTNKESYTYLIMPIRQ